MTDDQKDKEASVPVPMTEDGIPMVVNGERLSEVAIQALREAKARRIEKYGDEGERPKEVKGPGGREPTRYDDWEKDGKAIDF